MTDASSQFRIVLRGYEPAEVDRRVEELTIAMQEAARQRDELTNRLQNIEAERAFAAEEDPLAPPTYAHLGDRVGQILSLAEEEAASLLQKGADEVIKARAALEAAAEGIRTEADRYAAAKRSDAETDAARIVEDARRLADERLDSAERDASARLQEAEAIYEEQRARSAKIAADFESTLASRRKTAEAEYAAQLAEHTSALEEATRKAEQARADAERLQTETAIEVRRILDDAEREAATIVSDAKMLAAKVRADSERELTAASQRRDSINAQLANVRQMLATLTSTSSIALETPAVPGQKGPDHDQAMLESAD